MDNLREIIFVQVRTLNNFELRHCTMKLRQNSELKLQWELDKLCRTEGSLCHLNGGREPLEHEDLSCFAKLHPIESFDGCAMASEWLTSGISGTQLLDGSGYVAAHWQRHKWLHTQEEATPCPRLVVFNWFVRMNSIGIIPSWSPVDSIHWSSFR